MMTAGQPPEARSPAILTVAPNGARKTGADHPALPLSPQELALCAVACRDAGAAMLHLHVRDKAQKHSLSPDHYRPALEAIREAVGQELILQATTEAVGLYGPEAQMAAMRALRPEAMSLGLREYIADPSDQAATTAFQAFVEEALAWPCHLQFILYSAGDLAHFLDLQERDVIPLARPSLLFVLGRYHKDGLSSPRELLPFLHLLEQRAGSNALTEWPWSVCAFGPLENACAVAALSMGGHARLGFENNICLPDGTLAPDNAALISLAARAVLAQGRALADSRTARTMLGMIPDDK